MKTLNGLNRKLNPPNLRTEQEAIPTYRDVLIDSLKFSRPKDGSESIKLNRLADKVFDSTETLQVEDADFLLLKEKTNANATGYLTWVHGQVMEKILEWERS